MPNVSPLATPHTRTVTALVPGSASPSSSAGAGATGASATGHAAAGHSATGVPRLRSVGAGGHPGHVPVPAAALPPSTGVFRLPEGAVVATWPQAALPEQLAAVLPGVGALGGADSAMVGYLVLVPAGASVGFPGLAAAPATASAPPAAPSVAPLLAAVAPAPVQAAEEQVGIQLDVERRTARVDGEPLELTYLEFELLAHLTAHPHRVHTRDHLVSAVWGYGHVGDGRTVDVHVARLRRKLGADYRKGIVTVRRVGYKYVPPKAG
ncbi:hypothetical protein ABIA33_002055 [Streptacidiphilus sp. MAP12-16]|uniref:winged helix-turn-helix domain-containing protein n=1 Tax=Streptacidiphilus sp. MAP12-16 TaxID=3156300 RepID=UPI00351280A3